MYINVYINTNVYIYFINYQIKKNYSRVNPIMKKCYLICLCPLKGYMWYK